MEQSAQARIVEGKGCLGHTRNGSPGVIANQAGHEPGVPDHRTPGPMGRMRHRGPGLGSLVGNGSSRLSEHADPDGRIGPMRLKSPTGTQDGTTPAPPGEKPTTYRTVGSLVTGVLLIVFGVVGFVGFGFGAERHPMGAAVAAVIAVGGFVGGVYPAAFSHAEHFVIRNPFRSITIPWSRVSDVTARLSMVVFTRGEGAADTGESTGPKFTIWAIPVSMHERRKSDRNAAKATRDVRNASMRAAKSAGNADAMIHGGIGAPSPSAAARRGEAVMMDSLAFADQAVIEMRDRMRVCKTPLEAAGPVSVKWSGLTCGLVAASVLLVVLAAVGVPL